MPPLLFTLLANECFEGDHLAEANFAVRQLFGGLEEHVLSDDSGELCLGWEGHLPKRSEN